MLEIKSSRAQEGKKSENCLSFSPNLCINSPVASCAVVIYLDRSKLKLSGISEKRSLMIYVRQGERKDAHVLELREREIDVESQPNLCLRTRVV